ncbi:hypothetical protein JS73_09235 [Synergistes jonesii]|uniref:Uncharacterized protein n=2 Tax=Synergistes jonesii TaxID=2754 RepID=A0A073IQH3_9BACT|nr:hypothetical protein EH55_07110 [Synergistes jonesii]OFB61802.1 hypothetical protein JS73_09235 [Synergistes jonesii]OFB64107.1 hypothetical protein JS72_05230 [Synergistes jonesii]OFB67303.1 hypothetical protein JS78_09245 [Synergistes jonesii]OFB69204.1 hypothetical protein JS77_09255 [Synergistes jonesii]
MGEIKVTEGERPAQEAPSVQVEAHPPTVEPPHKKSSIMIFVAFLVLITVVVILSALIDDREKETKQSGEEIMATTTTSADITYPAPWPAKTQAQMEAEERQLKYDANEARKKLRAQTDHVENIVWRHSKLTPKYISGNSVFCYTGESEWQIWLRVVFGFSKDDWIFMEKIVLNIDGSIETIYVPYDERKTEVIYGGSIKEWVDFLGEGDIYSYISRIANSKTTLVKFRGEKYSRSFTVTENQKNAIKQVLKYYEAKKLLLK